jgi:hypothetical protein
MIAKVSQAEDTEYLVYIRNKIRHQLKGKELKLEIQSTISQIFTCSVQKYHKEEAKMVERPMITINQE